MCCVRLCVCLFIDVPLRGCADTGPTRKVDVTVTVICTCRQHIFKHNVYTVHKHINKTDGLRMEFFQILPKGISCGNRTVPVNLKTTSYRLYQEE